MIEGALAGVRPVYRRVRINPVPLRVYERLYGGECYGFLYESLEARGTNGRYSFLGGRPRLTVIARDGETVVAGPGVEQHLGGNPLTVLRDLLRVGGEALPLATFPGGAVGYLGYDVVRHIAPLGPAPRDDLGLPDVHMVFPEELVILDHVDEVAHLLAFADPVAGEARLDAIEAALRECEPMPAVGTTANDDSAAEGVALDDPPEALRSNVSEADFSKAVERAKAHIRAGDIFQVVLSQRFEFPVDSALSIYSALRRTNPSPYMYYLNLDGLEIAGSSPEIQVKLSGSRVTSRPLAGTRPRGRTAEEDAALEADLRADEKERAEHVMLVDLARNDLGRVCRVGSIDVQDYMGIERYARVMHLVSNVEGRLRDDRDAFDLFAATFPAGTVSGAPKVRAMQIIDDLEPARRGPYAGAIGHFSFLGDMDLCIAIRTVIVSEGRGFLQAGAGIVADSVPEREYQETLNKARGLTRAINLSRLSADS